jgi:hypothetical protein
VDDLLPASDAPRPPRRQPSIILIAAAAAVGVVVGRVIPPPVADGAWWATYLTSAGFAGTVAFLGAAAAASVAFYNSRRDRLARQLADRRSQWWDRFTWATEEAVDPESSVVGIKVLNRLVTPTLATEDDAIIALEILEIVDPKTESSEVKHGD